MYDYQQLQDATEAINDIQVSAKHLAALVTNTHSLISGQLEPRIREADKHFDNIAAILNDPALPPSMKLEQIGREVSIYNALYRAN